MCHEEKARSIMCNDVRKFRRSDLTIESTLGMGSFAVVFKAKITTAPAPAPPHRSSQPTPCSYYAIKCLNTKTRSTSSQAALSQAVEDLSSEAYLLSKLRHDNIIRLHGVSDCFGFNNQDNNALGCFVVLEMLETDTLKDRLTRWRRKESLRSMIITSTRSTRRRTTRTGAPTRIPLPTMDAIHDRIQNIAIGIARAMAYLHDQHNIVLRDLKVRL